MASDDPVVQELPWLRRLARRLAVEDGDDLVQEAWFLAHRDQPVVRGAGTLRPWLAQAMRNRLRSLRRSSASRARREQLSAPALQSGVDAERDAMAADVLRVLDDALASLTVDERTLLRERFFSDRTAVEIADALGVPPATVRTRLRRSLLRLRTILDRQHGGDRMRWAPAVVALPLPDPSVGVITMASAKGLAAAGAIVGLVALGLYWASGSGGAVASTQESHAPALDSGGAPRSNAASDRLGADRNSEPSAEAAGSPARRGSTIAAEQQRGGSGRVAPEGQGDPRSLSAIEPPTDPARVRQCATAAAKHDCDFLLPDALVLEDMAACGIVRYDFPAMFAQHDWTPEFEEGWLDLVGATGVEREALIVAGDGYRDTLFAELSALGLEVGLEPWPTDATLLTAVVELSRAVGDDAVAEASRTIAQERAGHAEPPASTESLPAAERFARLFTEVGDGFEAAIAERLGDTRARELRLAQDGWPGLKAQTGARCPD